MEIVRVFNEFERETTIEINNTYFAHTNPNKYLNNSYSSNGYNLKKRQIV